MPAISSPRTTLSFYRYVHLDEPDVLAARLRACWSVRAVLGRIYLAHEGINAQLSLPSDGVADFVRELQEFFPDVPIKTALEEPVHAFAKLTIKVRAKLVGDGLSDASFDPAAVGTHLDAAAFHAAMDLPGTIVVDMRNRYESEVGHFRGALLPESSTFRDVLPEVVDQLRGQEDKKILLYCTGGIRCEKASAWLKHQGFRDVNQLHGGIIAYGWQVAASGVDSRFLGKNFVFDKRLGERVTADIVAHCHQCGTAYDTHKNCAFPGCNRLFLQCEACATNFAGCCSPRCQEAYRLPHAERVAVQHAWEREFGKDGHWRLTRKPLPPASASGSSGT